MSILPLTLERFNFQVSTAERKKVLQLYCKATTNLFNFGRPMWSRNSSSYENTNTNGQNMPLVDSTLPTSTGSSPLDIVPESAIPKPPTLHRGICLSDNKSLTNFLKLSRQNVDDNLKTRLNGILNHHESSDKRSILPIRKLSSPSDSPCIPLITQLIFPQWTERVNSIEYCINESQKMLVEVQTEEKDILNEEERNKLLRVDPYGLRDIEAKIRNKNVQAQSIMNKFKNEAMIEGIIRERSTELVTDYCNLGEFDLAKEFNDHMTAISKK